jgi:CRISPR/Cas system-associated exonuclease Cas4 (RecB family)
MQLGLYALALEKYAGRIPDRALLYFLRSNSVVEVRLDTDAARLAVRAFLDAQESTSFPLRQGEQCRQCSFFQNRCPAQLA